VKQYLDSVKEKKNSVKEMMYLFLYQLDMANP